jgi:hypothetical protein
MPPPVGAQEEVCSPPCLEEEGGPPPPPPAGEGPPGKEAPTLVQLYLPLAQVGELAGEDSAADTLATVQISRINQNQVFFGRYCEFGCRLERFICLALCSNANARFFADDEAGR